MPSFTLQTSHYGPDAYQVGDLYLPEEPARAVVCLLHGGFWRMPYDRMEMAPLAAALAEDGFAVWNMEYRRLGGGGGWPETFLDIAAGIDHLAELDLPLDKVVVAGHSAGGHLALWSARREGFPGVPAPRVRLHGVAGLAPVADLAAAHDLALGRSAVAEFLGASPADGAARYDLASPLRRLPLGVKQLIVHGARDEALPAELSRAYAERARLAGDDVTYAEPADAGHMDFLDPGSEATRVFRHWLISP